MSSKVNEMKLRARVLKAALTPEVIPVSDVMGWRKSHWVTHGKYANKKNKLRPQYVAQYLIDQNNPSLVHIHYLCWDKDTAREIAKRIPKHHAPWFKGQRSTMSWGLEKDWHHNPFFVPGMMATVNKRDNPSDRYVGPYYVAVARAVNDKAYVEIQGVSRELDKVSDGQIDVSDNGELSYREKLALNARERAWADAVRAGELPSYTQ
tara:strand:- start:904 stop:1524 length:621 start_codon:yes stop_codon:yes gene_type:complete